MCDINAFLLFSHLWHLDTSVNREHCASGFCVKLVSMSWGNREWGETEHQFLHRLTCFPTPESEATMKHLHGLSSSFWYIRALQPTNVKICAKTNLLISFRNFIRHADETDKRKLFNSLNELSLTKCTLILICKKYSYQLNFLLQRFVIGIVFDKAMQSCIIVKCVCGGVKMLFFYFFKSHKKTTFLVWNVGMAASCCGNALFQQRKLLGR